jgi:hypothetical protein
MRSRMDQIEHKPFFCIFDTDTRKYEKHFIPIDDWSEVFDLEKKVKSEERNEKLEAFVSGLSKHKEMGLSFEENIRMYIQRNRVPEDVWKIIEDGMQI